MLISSGDAPLPVRLTASASGSKPLKRSTNRLRGSKSARSGLLTITPKLVPDESVRHAKKKRHKKEPEEVEEEKEPEPALPPPKPAWSQFEDHVKVVSRSDLFLGEKKESYSTMCSEDHQKTLTEIKAMGLKKQVRSMKMRVKAIQSIRKAKVPVVEVEEVKVAETDEESSEDEEVKQEKEKKREQARYHWEVLRRYIDDRIRQRRKKKGGFNKDRAFNRLRAQAKATLNPEQTRRDIFERYGIVPKPGKLYPENIMKPMFSNRAHDIIARFEQIQVISIVPNEIRHRGYSHMRQKEKILPRSRPNTTTPGRSRRFI